MARKMGIWISGLIACGLFGAILGGLLDTSYTNGANGAMGLFAGAFAFICLRLWFGSRSPQS